MTALAAARLTQSKSRGNIQRHLMTASKTIYAGSMVALDSAGTAVPAADTVGFKGVVGVAIETVTSGASVAAYVRVQEGVYLLAGSSLAQARVGEGVYVGDDQTVVLSPGSTNMIKAGILVEYVGSSSGWVLVGPAVAKPRHHVYAFPCYLMTSIVDGDFVTNFVPGYAGRIRSLFWVQGAAVTTGSKLSNINAEIGTTDVTGGVIALTSAACTPLGKYIAGSAVTALNLFDENDTISIEASSTTAFIEGSGTIYMVCEQF